MGTPASASPTLFVRRCGTGGPRIPALHLRILMIEKFKLALVALATDRKAVTIVKYAVTGPAILAPSLTITQPTGTATNPTSTTLQGPPKRCSDGPERRSGLAAHRSCPLRSPAI